MKFGKNLIRVVELSDPEWGPYWINYKFMKKKINEIVETQGGRRPTEHNLSEISKSATEVDFFRLLKTELKKTSDFFSSAEQLCRIRHQRVRDGFVMLQDNTVMHDKNTWTRLLMACVKFYKDVLLLENFAIMNYCGFSKILKKHDKSTGFSTREAFMRNVMSQQNFTHYPYVLDLLKQSERLFAEIQEMESCMPLQDEERLFIEAIRDLNYQASKLQAEENQVMEPHEGEVQAEEGSRGQKHPKEITSGSGPTCPLSRLAALAAASEADECASKTLDLAAQAVMQAAQKANHNTTSYNLDGAISWIQAHRENVPPLTSPSTDAVTSRDRQDNSGSSNTTDEEDDGILIPGSKKKNKKIALSKRSFSTFSQDSEDQNTNTS